MLELAFIETAEEVQKWLVLRNQDHLHKASVIALTPWAELLLHREGVAFTRPQDYYSEADLIELGLGNFHRLETFCEYVDIFIKAQVPELREEKLKLLMCHFFWLKVLFDAASSHAFILNHILARTNPDKVFYFETKPSRPFSRAWLDYLQESVYSLLIPLICDQRRIASTSLGKLNWIIPGFDDNGRKNSWSELWRITGARAFQQLQRLVKVAPIFRRFSGNGSEGTIIALDASLRKELLIHRKFGLIEWDAIKSRRIDWRKGWLRRQITHVPEDLPARTREESLLVWKRLPLDTTFRDFFLFCGIDVFPIVQSRIEHVITQAVPEILSSYLATQKLCSELRPALMLSGSLSDCCARAAAQAARSLGIPVVVYDHGGIGWFDFPMERYLDIWASDYRLVWGPGVRDSAQRRYADGAIPIATGSVMLDDLVARTQTKPARRSKIANKLGLVDDRPNVLYAPTSLHSNFRYFSFHSISDSDYFAIQRQILSVFRDFPNVRLIVKFHPNTSFPVPPLPQLAQDYGMENVVFIRDISLSEMLPLADLFINDSPTTTLLQMLTTRKRVLVFGNPAFHWEPGAIELLRHSAVFSEDIQEFSEILRDHLLKKRFDPLETDQSDFLKMYGTCDGDGQSERRLIESLISIANKSMNSAQQ